MRSKELSSAGFCYVEKIEAEKEERNGCVDLCSYYFKYITTSPYGKDRKGARLDGFCYAKTRQTRYKIMERTC